MLLKGKKEQDRSVCKKHPQERQFNMFFFFTFFVFNTAETRWVYVYQRKVSVVNSMLPFVDKKWCYNYDKMVWHT